MGAQTNTAELTKNIGRQAGMRKSDIIKFKQFLDDQARHYATKCQDQSNIKSNIQMKHYHSIKVHALVKKLAMELNLDDKISFQAQAAALLHDIGRFPQIIDYYTYEDPISIDHAELGVKILQDEKVLVNLTSEDAEVITTAVRYHNKLRLPQEIVGQTGIVAKTLRDADKIDIIRIAIDFYTAEIDGRKTGWYSELSSSSTCTPSVVTALLADEDVPISHVKTLFDEFLLYLSWVNSLHFADSVRHLVQSGNLQNMIRLLPGKTMQEVIGNYVFHRVKERFLVTT